MFCQRGSLGAEARSVRVFHPLSVLDEPTVGLHMADVENSSMCCTGSLMPATV